MLLGASKAINPISPTDKTPEHVHSTARRRVVTSERDGRDISGHRERATVGPDGLRSMHYYKVYSVINACVCVCLCLFCLELGEWIVAITE